MNEETKIPQGLHNNDKDQRTNFSSKELYAATAVHGILKRPIDAGKDKIAVALAGDSKKQESKVVTFGQNDELEDVSDSLDEENRPNMNDGKIDLVDGLSNALAIETDNTLPIGVKNMEIENSNCCKNSPPRRCCRPAQKFGNISVICPSLYNRYRIGVVGPNWLGPIITILIFVVASQYFMKKSLVLGTWSFVPCVVFSVVTIVSLFFVSCSDPGIVKSDSNEGGRSHEYEGIPSQEVDLSGW
eukprot:CAMPEP_0197833716 /NCGR_PEP_ID=MMETSP1437-20131217/19906_1 /TAXON_ID=49252 ORGANISM="Eucampia antarctica, Strain CCMP1452" /NCGR_SAMPLE_ID=MMETSP1437 /ASSEMBLY_ACC=CAM_ASM_001096 /LENGTH=243 /DNA_ID=CAMNT_0043437937 /DNA_START=32 /DNA_END=760 /DNA_ORIENTATION=-